MLRQAFKLKLKPGGAAEYEKRHDELWPELAAALKAAGVSDYSIFLDEDTLTLFAVQTVSHPKAVADLAHAPIVRRWWEFMAPLLDTHPDGSPVVHPLREVFRLD